MSEDGGSGPGRPSKVARLIEEYGLEGLGAELERAWTAPVNERKSLRELAALVNRRVVEAALADTGDRPLQGEIETVTEALTGGTGGATERDVRGRLDQRGVDPESLQRDLVSHQAVKTYLTSVRGVEYESPNREPIRATRERIQGLRGRLQTVTADQLTGLAERGAITLGESRVLVQVQVYCEDCGRQFDVEDLLDRGGCDCE
ncbi:MAG: rod-determining factor RdfA [Halodesulfurarchaeum sp.]